MKIVVITGASRGIGRSAAKAFAKEGYSLLLNCEKNIDLLEGLKVEIEEEAKSLEITLKQGDFSSEFLAKYFQNKEIDELILLINQGKSTLNLTQDYTAEEIETLFQANLLEPFHLTQRLIPYLLRAKEARVLFSSSVWGNVGASMESLYSLTKGGINSFVKALGKELAPSHIAVNAVAFGAIDTDMNAWLSEEEKAELEESIPYGRMAKVEEAADFLLLLSKAPLYLTAQVIPFDGGWI